MIPMEPARRIIDDLVHTTRGTKFTRATQPRKPFAICIAQEKRDELILELRQVQRLTDARPIDCLWPSEVRIDGALIGSIVA